MYRKFTYILLALASLCAYAQDVVVTTKFVPSVLSPGESGQFHITIEGDVSDPTLKNLSFPDGVNFSYLGPNNQVNIINGVVQQSITAIYRVIPERVGEFTVPAFQVVSGRTAHQAPAATLRVKQGGSQLDSDTPATKLNFYPTTEKIYVGQKVIGVVEALVHESLQLVTTARSPIMTSDSFSGGDFIQNSVQQIDRQEGDHLYKGRRYVTQIKPLKSGTHTLQFDYAVEVSSNKQTSDWRTHSIFDDFFKRHRATRHDMSTGTIEIEVLPLPFDNMPKNFTGGIGEFSIGQPDLSTTRTQVGEPISLTISISGSGNFDTIQPPKIADSADWRVFEPEVTFEANDEFGYEGTKRFEYVLIPQRSGEMVSPVISFSAFSPEKGDYYTLSAPGKKVLVVATDSSQQAQTQPALPEPQAPQPETPEPEAAPKIERPSNLLPIQRESDKWYGGLLPFIMRPWFLLLNGLTILALAGLYPVLRKRIRLREDARYARELEIRKRYNESVSRAASAKDSEVFLAAATDAIACLCYRIEPIEIESALWPDIQKRLKQINASDELMAACKKYYTQDNELRYSGGADVSTPSHTELKSTLEDLRKCL